MKRWLPWIGWAFSLAGVSILLMSARWKLTFDPWYVKEWGRLGWDPNMLPRVALIQLACVVLYLTPRTAVLGVVLLTGYLGGAIRSTRDSKSRTPCWFRCRSRCSRGPDSTCGRSDFERCCRSAGRGNQQASKISV